jgi:hypothetical protein
MIIRALNGPLTIKKNYLNPNKAGFTKNCPIFLEPTLPRIHGLSFDK